VSTVGNAIEAAANELREVGMGTDKHLVPKYTMQQLLDPEFRLPRPPTAKDERRNAISALRALGRVRGVRYVGPAKLGTAKG